MTDPHGPGQAPVPDGAFLALLPELRRVARRLARSPEDADDLVQDTLLRLWSRLALARYGHADTAPVADLRAYAMATLRNRARTPPAGPPQIPTDAADVRADPAADPEARALVRETLSALTGLPDDQRRLLRLRGLDGLSYAEIAAETGLSVGTVTSRLSRGRRALRRALDLPDDAPLGSLIGPPDAGS